MSNTHIVLCFCFVCLRLLYAMLPVFLDRPFFIAPSVSSNAYFDRQDSDPIRSCGFFWTSCSDWISIWKRYVIHITITCPFLVNERELLLKWSYWTKGSYWSNWSHHFERLTVATMTWLTAMEYLCYIWPWICSVDCHPWKKNRTDFQKSGILF